MEHRVPTSAKPLESPGTLASLSCESIMPKGAQPGEELCWEDQAWVSDRRREEGIQNSGRLAGAQAKPEREAEHVFSGLMRFRVGTRMKRLDWKICVCKAKEKGWNFDLSMQFLTFFAPHTEFNFSNN